MGRLSKLKNKQNRMRYIYTGYLNKKAVDPKTVLFESFHGKEISDSPLAMARDFLGRPEAAGYKVYFSSNDVERDKAKAAAIGLDAQIVHIHSNKYAELLATAGYLINNSSFPSYYIRRAGQTYLQTWHGTPLKSLGKSMRHGIETMHNVQHNFLQANWLMFPNDFTRDAIMGDYNLDRLYTGKVAMCGYPRNSIFSRPDEAVRIKSLCGDDGISTLAYMPTWRGQDNKNISTDEFTEEISALLAQLDEALSDDQKLYVNLHPIVQKSVVIDGYKHIYTFPKDIEKYEFINSMDALITDYSSVFFDYSITGKPVILFTYDYDEYVSDHGLYMGIDELPFMRINSTEELAECLKTKSYEGVSYAEDSGYMEKFTAYDSADATARLVDLIFGDKTADEAGIKVIDYSGNIDLKREIIDCKTIKTTDDLDAINNQIDKFCGLALFYQSDFTPELSEYMHDNYANAFDYIFATKSQPISYSERLSRNRNVKNELKRRDLYRRIGPLDIQSLTKFTAPSVQATSLLMKGEHCIIDMKFPANLGTLEDIRLIYRSNVDHIEHQLKFESSISGNGMVTAHTDVDLSVLRAGCVYWDFVLYIRKDDELHPIQLDLSKKIRNKLTRGFYQSNHEDGFISFPHITLDKTLAFTHREKTDYDTRFYSFKEAFAVLVSKLRRKSLKKKRIWLVFEKFCSAAQDNGFYFFKYCMENLPEEEKKNIYYVIQKNSGDYDKVKPYSDHVIQYMSLKHLVYAMSAKLCVGSDSKKHLYIWRPKPNLVSRRMRNIDIHFLQHGVTALKRVDGIFGKTGSSPMTSVTTTSKFEQQIMMDNWGYTKAEAPVVGFTRWDVLHDKSTPDEKIILVMPTWRAWLEERTDEDFLTSDYFRNYMALLADESLKTCLDENNVKLIFFIHPKFKNFLSQFSTSSDNIEFVQFGSRPLNEIMMHCSMLITDYSSVCWDVYYMGKPVIFYQFDYDMYMENHGSYMDMENDLFGDRFTELPDLIESIKNNIENNFEESERAKSMRNKYFEYIDDDNSKRTYEYLRKRGY